MNTVHQRWWVNAVGLFISSLLCACALNDGDYEGNLGIAYVGDYYEPYGDDYGGWASNYYVGPPRGGEYRPHHRPTRPIYLPHGMRHIPSIPTRARSI